MTSSIFGITNAVTDAAQLKDTLTYAKKLILYLRPCLVLMYTSSELADLLLSNLDVLVGFKRGCFSSTSFPVWS